MIQIGISFAFLAANVLILLVVLALNRRVGSAPRHKPLPLPASPGERDLDASDILGWEFEYARITASESMQQRHTMVNFYLLVAGVVASGVIAVLGGDAGLPKAVGTMLLWLLCGIGWLYFLAIVRLRQAWHDSARTMNRIKTFYIQHAREFDSQVLRTAFRWQAHTLPPPDKPWTVHFYSVALIGLLDSVAYVAGAALVDLRATSSSPLLVGGLLATFGLAFFAFHIWLYFAFLKPGPPRQPARDVHTDVHTDAHARNT
jgi:hypothetical protein